MGQAWCSGNDWCGNGSSKEERKYDLLGKQNNSVIFQYKGNLILNNFMLVN
jgi:hypothetical protein